MRALGRQFGKIPEKSADLFRVVQRGAEERRGRRRRAPRIVLAAKTVGVTLPCRVVIAAGSVDQQQVADDAESRFGRKVAWAAECGGLRALFTSLSVPVMTRLRMPERRVLDTLVDAGVARSRSDALAWCVRLVRSHEGEWIDELRDALVHVEAVRERGPGADAPDS